ncbi:MAG: ATP-binding protein [Candidatus Eremiobacterota bacterium]
MERRYARLLDFARQLQGATDFHELLLIVQREVEESTGYRQAWFYLPEGPDLGYARLIDAVGVDRGIWEKAPVLEIRGDAMLEEIMQASGPVVVEDARTDPRTNKSIVESVGCRTLINVPMMMADHPLGVLGTGTFEDEGVRPPTPDQVDYLMAVAQQLSVAAARVRLAEERAAAERAQRQLFLIQKMDTVGLLAAGVLHDLKGLLAAILGGAELLAEECLSVQQQQVVEFLRASAAQAERLTRPLLAIARQQPLEALRVDFLARLVQVRQVVGPQLPDGVRLEVEVEPGLSCVEGDPDLLDQVLLNLILNARDAMPRGGRLRVQVDAWRDDGRLGLTFPWAVSGPYVRIRVSDTGKGIPPELQDRIFDPFYTTKPPGQGTGLGLAVCAGIVRQHRGVLVCESQPGRGSTFTVYLPAWENRQEPAPERRMQYR